MVKTIEELERSANAEIEFRREIGKTHPEFLTAKLQENRKRLQAKTSAIKTGLSAFQMFKPVIIIGAIAFLLIGPASAAIIQLTGAINMWWWIAFIIIGLLFWRYK